MVSGGHIARSRHCAWQCRHVVVGLVSAVVAHLVSTRSADASLIGGATRAGFLGLVACTGFQCGGNSPPIANAGPDRTAAPGVVVPFDGAGSSDADGSVIAYWFNFGDGGYTGWQASPQAPHVYTNAGVYNVSLWVQDNCGAVSAADNSVVTISVGACQPNQPPTANAGGDRAGAVQQPLPFTGAASHDPDGSIQSYTWDFGDGAAASGVEAIHAYDAPGLYTVVLTVVDNCGASGATQANVLVAAPGGGAGGVSEGTGHGQSLGGGQPQLTSPCQSNKPPRASAGPDKSGNAGQPVAFSAGGSQDDDGIITRYDWDFGDQTTGSGFDVVHAYAAPGQYTVRLTVTDNCGDFASDTAAVTISNADPCQNNQLPVANAGPDKTGVVGQAVSFSGSSSFDPDGSVVNYSWNFGNGATASGVSVSHAFSAAGTFTVTLTVTDNCGATRFDTAVATISAPQNQAPVANAGPDLNGTAGQNVTLNGGGSYDPDGTVTAWWWNYGDGASSGWLTTATTTHAYANASTYTATLWVRDNAGAVSAPDNALVTIQNSNPCQNNQPPVANAGPDKTGTVGQAISFSGSGSSDPDGSIVSYSWNFGNGATGSGVNVSHAYSAAGQYTVTLTVTDNCNVTRTDTAVATVSSAPPPPPPQLQFLGVVPGLGDVRGVAFSAADGLLYAASIQFGLSVVDLSGTQPVVVGVQDIPASAQEAATGVEVFGEIAVTYSNYGSTQFLSLESPTTPRLRSTLSLSGYDVALHSNHAFLAHGLGGLKIINVADLENPIVVATVPMNARAVALRHSGNYAYVAAGTSGLQVVDITNPISPQIVANVPISSGSASDICLDAAGEHAFLATGIGGIRILSLANPAAPIQVGAYPMPSTQISWSLGRLVATRISPSGYCVLDATVPASLIQTAEGFASVFATCTKSDRMVTALGAGGVAHYRFLPESPFIPTPEGTLSTAIASRLDVSVEGSIALVCAQYSHARIVNLADPTNPVPIASISIPADGGALRGALAFLAAGSSGLRIVDWTTQPNPTPLSTLQTTAKAIALTQDGQWAFVAASTAGLKIVNVTTPTNPIVVATLPTNGACLDVALNAEGTIAYLANGPGGLAIVGVAQPASPVLLATLPVPCLKVELEGSIAALVHSGSPGFSIANVAVPNQPVQLGAVTSGGSAFSVLVWAGRLYASRWSNERIDEYDISNPASPVLTGFVRTHGQAGALALMGNKLIVGDDAALLEVFAIGSP